MGAFKFVILLVGITASVTFGFVGKDNTEAWLRFSHFVDIPAESRPTKAEQNEAIEDQLLYLYGPLGLVEKYAVPKGEHTVSKGTIEKAEEGLYRVYYDYEGLIQVKKGPRTRYTVVLPRQTSEDFIYAPGVNKKGVNVCTEKEHNTFGDFWYFWAPKPYWNRCPLKEGLHFDMVQGELERIPNTMDTYPEYDRLADASGEIPIFIFLGMDEATKSTNPLESEGDEEQDDLNAQPYRTIRKRLVKMGFSKPERLSDEEMSRILDKRHFKRPFVETLTKRAGKANLKVTLFFGRTGIDETSSAFHYFYKEANEKAAVMIYDGHSGLGGHLDLSSIEQMHGFKIRMPKKRYQIFFFNSCTSYSYYNTLYFYRKKGRSTRNETKNLDILTDGLATGFEDDQATNLALVRAVNAWAEGDDAPNYQELAKEMDQRNLFGVNGDEDNPTTLP